jgi:hypothetical protein
MMKSLVSLSTYSFNPDRIYVQKDWKVQSWRKSTTNYRTWCPVDSGILLNLPDKLKIYQNSDRIFENVLIFVRLFDAQGVPQG